MKKLRENSIIFYILVNIALIRSLLNYNKSVYVFNWFCNFINLFNCMKSIVNNL